MKECLLSKLKTIFNRPLFTIRNNRQEDVKQIACLLEKLRCSNKQLRMYKEFWTHIGNALILINADTGIVLDANPAACAMYGYRREDVINKKSLQDFSAEPECSMAAIRERVTRINLRWHLKRGGIRFPIKADLTYFSDQGYTVCAVILREVPMAQDMMDLVN